jgi:hypothetical protein
MESVAILPAHSRLDTGHACLNHARDVIAPLCTQTPARATTDPSTEPSTKPAAQVICACSHS